MPKTPKFGYRKTDRGWLVNVPASLSDTGKRERRYFKTRDKAKAEDQRLRDQYRKHGEGSTTMPPRATDDAARAMEILAPFEGVSLCEAARFYRAHHDVRARAPTLEEAWDRALELRSTRRPTTQRDYRHWKRALPDALLKKNVVDISPEEIRRTVYGITDGSTRRKNGLKYISAVFQQCVKDGLLTENPCKRIQLPREPEQPEEVVIYTPSQLEALFAACKDYGEGRDRKCGECKVPFAILAFAGLRPNELERLSWSDIDTELGVIRIETTLTKRARRRNVRIQPTLQAWLDTVPPTDRVGRIVPPRWKFRSARVRREAGIDGLAMAEALRHSFGTYLLATEGDLNALKSDMGHEHVKVYFEHSPTPLTKEEALPYWQVLPEGANFPTFRWRES